MRAAAIFLVALSASAMWGASTDAVGGAMTRARALAVDAYPLRPIRILVGFPPGNATDMLARFVGAKLGERLDQQVVVDNRSGANGIIAAHVAANAPRDGHTLLFMSASHTMNAAVNKLPFDAVESFAPVTMLGKGPLVLVAHAGFPVRSVESLIAEAKAKPNAISYASVGSGGINHFAAALLAKVTAIQLVHVPYKGGVPALADVMAGHVQLMFGTLPLTLGPLHAGRINALAVTDSARTPLLPHVPTMIESGIGYEVTNWWGVLAPAGVPSVIVAKLNNEIATILTRRDSAQRLETDGIVPSPLSSAAFARKLEAEVEKWRRVAREADIRAD